MKEIPLTQGKVAIVDDENYEWLSQWKWYAFDNKYTFYAARQIRIEGKQHREWMHRVILGIGGGHKIITDHRDRNGLHNWKDNLRIVPRCINSHNRKVNKNNQSGYRGVYWHNNHWEVEIKSQGRSVYCGSYNNPILAAKAYDKNIVKIYGIDAVLNFPKGGNHV